MKSLSLPNKIEDALPALSELLRRSVDGTVPPLFIDYENQRVLIRSTTASAGTSVFEVALWGSITTGGVSTYLSTANFRSAVNVTGTTNTIGTINARNALSVTGALDVFNGAATFQGGVSSTGLAKFQNSFTDFLGDLRITGNTNSSGTSNWLNVTAGRLNISSTADFRSELNVTGASVFTTCTASEIQLNTYLASGTTPKIDTSYSNQIIKAIIKFDMSAASSAAAIKENFNIQSMTDNGVADWTVAWDRDFAAGTYCIVGMAGDPGVSNSFLTLRTSSPNPGDARFLAVTDAGLGVDAPHVMIIALGRN